MVKHGKRINESAVRHKSKSIFSY